MTNTGRDIAKPQGRLTALDGLRGIAALIVVFHHFCCAFLPQFETGLNDHPNWLVDTPLGILVNGHFSVSIFFVLSGFVVARAAAKNSDPFYINIPLRYLRLALPSTASVLFAWGLLTLIPNAALRLNEIHASPWLTQYVYQKQIPGIFSVFCSGLVVIFLGIGSNFNNVLWTMHYEAMGSMAIYLLYGITRGRTRRIFIVLIGLATLRYPNYLCFVLGALMMELWSEEKLRYGHPVAALSTGILLGFPGHGFAARWGFPHGNDLWSIGESGSLFASVAAALILYAVLNSRLLDKMLSSRIPKFLGQTSFPLYLVHVPLLYTVFALAYVWIKPASGLFILPLFASFLATSLVLAWTGEASIDKPVLNGIHWARKKLREQRSAKKVLTA